MNHIFTVENKWARRAYIMLFVITAIPFVILIGLAEILWDSTKAIFSVVKSQISEVLPTIKEYAATIKEYW